MCPFHLFLACLLAIIDPSAQSGTHAISPVKMSVKLVAATGLFIHLRDMKKRIKKLEKKNTLHKLKKV